MLRLFGSLILTRIFAPDVFGVLAIVTAIIILPSLLTDMGLRQAVVQSSNGGNASFINTAWTLQLLRGILVWSISTLSGIALYVAGSVHLLAPNSVYADPDLPTFIVVASFSAVILGFQSMKVVTAGRDLDLKRVIYIEFFSQIVSLTFVILVGWATRSIWSYIAGTLLGNCVLVLMSHVWLHGPRDRLTLDPNALKELKGFGKWVFASSALGAAAMSGDKLMLAAWATPTVVGHYSIANNLSSVAEILANRIFGSVALPSLSEVRRSQPGRFPVVFFRLRWFVDSVMLCAAGFLFSTAPSIIEILYDPRYSPAGWMFRWLSCGLLFARYGVVQSAYVALGRPNYITSINVIKLASLFSCVPFLFYMFGISGAVIGIAFHMLPSTLCTFFYNQRHNLNNFRLELAVLSFWPIGWALGQLTVKLMIAAKLYLFAPV